jgi:MoxR-like ATPase
MFLIKKASGPSMPLFARVVLCCCVESRVRGKAAAQALGRPFLSKVVNARFEPEDLLFRVDALARLGKAHVGSDVSQLSSQLFLLPELLWWALDPVGAGKQFGDAAPHCGDAGCDYSQDTGISFTEAETTGVVVLIDEIDKADSEVPNSLLEVLSIGGFQLPHGAKTVKAAAKPPLIIITTNEDRELPPAFLRRCLVHQMDLPKDEAALDAHLQKRVAAHFKGQIIHASVLTEAIQQLKADRAEMKKNDLPPPGQAELLDLLRAVVDIAKTEADQRTVLEQLKGMTFRKHRSL